MSAMTAADIPIGIDLFSPVTWAVVAIGAIVLALTMSTRRSNTRPRPLVPPPVSVPPPPAAAANPPGAAAYASDWAAAHALFVENPRAGGERARAIVERAARERGAGVDGIERYRLAAAITDRPDPTTDQLREAFVGYRAAFDALIASAPGADR